VLRRLGVEAGQEIDARARASRERDDRQVVLADERRLERVVDLRRERVRRAEAGDVDLEPVEPPAIELERLDLDAAVQRVALDGHDLHVPRARLVDGERERRARVRRAHDALLVRDSLGPVIMAERRVVGAPGEDLLVVEGGGHPLARRQEPVTRAVQQHDVQQRFVQLRPVVDQHPLARIDVLVDAAAPDAHVVATGNGRRREPGRVEDRHVRGPRRLAGRVRRRLS
jgi:hypothetical protein